MIPWESKRQVPSSLYFFKTTLLWTRLYWSQTILLYQSRKLAVALIYTQYESMFVRPRRSYDWEWPGWWGGGRGGGWKVDYSCQALRSAGGNSNRVEFPSEDINYSFTSGTRWRKQKWPITTIVECNEEKFSAFFKYFQWMQLSRCHRAEFGGRATSYLLASQLWERVRIHSLLPSRSQI